MILYIIVGGCMNGDVFINHGFDIAIKRYLLLKNEKYFSLANDFLVYVIYMLNFIYGEDNIFKPYYNRKNNGYKILLDNLKVYGLSEEKINKFFKDISAYLDTEITNNKSGLQKNEFFTYLQEDLIDMFLCKAEKLCYSKDYYDQFRNLLFFSGCSNEKRRNLNEKYATNLDATVNYFDYKVYEMTSSLTFISVKENLLGDKIYKMFGLNSENLETVNQNTLDEINNKIYSYFKINPIESSSLSKLEKAVEKIARSRFKLANNSGHINVLLFILVYILTIVSGIITGLYFIKNLLL